MESYVREKIKKENGAVTLLVIVTVLTFVAVLLGAYLTVTTLQKSQLESNKRIQEIYGEDVNKVDIIYEELTSKDSENPYCNITSTVVNNTAINYKFTFSESVTNFTVDDIKINTLAVVNTGLESQMQLSTSNPSYAASLNNGKTYVVSFDYKCVANSQNFEIGLYSDTNTNLPTKTLTATTQLKHENYRIAVTDTQIQFKMLAQIAQSNNITISNFEILEIENTEIEKGSFTKVNNTEYTLMCEYDANTKYVVIIEKNVYEDENANKNDETIYVS